MNSIGKKIVLIATAVALVLGLSACDVVPGGACHTEGEKHTNENGTSFTCLKNVNNGGRLFWSQDGVIRPDRP